MLTKRQLEKLKRIEALTHQENKHEAEVAKQKLKELKFKYGLKDTDDLFKSKVKENIIADSYEYTQTAKDLGFTFEDLFKQINEDYEDDFEFYEAFNDVFQDEFKRKNKSESDVNWNDLDSILRWSQS